jgi:hypothetical protein
VGLSDPAFVGRHPASWKLDAVLLDHVRGWELWAKGASFPDPVPPDLFVYSQRAFDSPDRRPFRCLDPNLFDLDPIAGSGNFVDFPQTLTVQPFWA